LQSFVINLRNCDKRQHVRVNIMKQLNSNIAFNETHERIGEKINSHLKGLDRYKKDDKQKILELCQIGKLLGTFFNEFEIVNVTEKPDFIISNGNQNIGVEHELILDTKYKAEEGFYENICEKVETNLKNDSSLPNFLVNLYLKDNLSFKIKDKNNLIEEFTELVKEFVLTGKLNPNNLVKNAHKMKHSQKNVNVNFGAYMQQHITKELLLEYIAKKEKKNSSYRQNTGLPQWLVLVIGGTGKSSLEVNNLFNIELISDFDKIFLYEDFDNNLYELK
jgi:hypothetical protein